MDGNGNWLVIFVFGEVVEGEYIGLVIIVVIDFVGNICIEVEIFVVDMVGLDVFVVILLD